LDIPDNHYSKYETATVHNNLLRFGIVKSSLSKHS